MVVLHLRFRSGQNFECAKIRPLPGLKIVLFRLLTIVEPNSDRRYDPNFAHALARGYRPMSNQWIVSCKGSSAAQWSVLSRTWPVSRSGGGERRTSAPFVPKDQSAPTKPIACT